MAADLTLAALLYRSGPHQDFPLSGPEATLGFGGRDVIRIPMEGVSRRHAKILFDGKDYWIEDAGSSNGTFLNGKRLTKRERLRHLDVVTLGRHTDLIFVLKAGGDARVTRHGIKAASIEAIDGLEAGTRWTIPRGSITLGRAPSNNVVVDSQLISKIHARLECTGLQLVITDLHSHNGTYVDGEKIVEPRIVEDGDELVLAGARRFRVHIEEGSIETSGVGPLPLQARSEAALPMDWQTRMEWTPDELASFERGRKGDTGLREAAPRLPAPEAKPAMVKPPPAPAKPEVKPAAAPAKPEAKPPAEAPKPEAKPAAIAAKPAEVAAAPPKAEVKPPLVAPSKAAEVKPEVSAAKVAEARPAAVAKALAKPVTASKSDARPAAAPSKPAELDRPAAAAKPENRPPVPAPDAEAESQAATRKPADASPPAPLKAAAEVPAAAATPSPASPPKPEVEAPPPAPPVASPPVTPPVAAPVAEAKKPDPGTTLPPPPPAQEPSPPELRKRAARISGEATRALIEEEAKKPRVHLEGEGETLSLPVGDHVVGRLAGMSVRLDAHEVSRRHAVIHVSNAEVLVEDLRSHNGTFVNGEKVTTPRRLNPGDLLHFGDVGFRVRFPGPAPQ